MQNKVMMGVLLAQKEKRLKEQATNPTYQGVAQRRKNNADMDFFIPSAAAALVNQAPAPLKPKMVSPRTSPKNAGVSKPKRPAGQSKDKRY